jgi:hypothetical protein
MRKIASKQDTSNLSSGIFDIGPNLAALVTDLLASLTTPATP